MAFDSLIAKVIAHTASADFPAAAAKAARALGDFRIEGVETNIPFLQALLTHPDLVANRIDTRFIETRLAKLLEAANQEHRKLYFDAPEADAGDARASALEGRRARSPSLRRCRGSSCRSTSPRGIVRPGQQIAVIESMKMEHLVTAPGGGIVRETRARKGDTLYKDDAIVFLEPADVSAEAAAEVPAADPEAVRPDLAEMLARQAFGFDENRPEAVARRRKTNHRTARENVAALADPGSFLEYGSLAVAAQAARRSRDDLIRNTPGDGVVAGLATVNGGLFGPERARCLVVAYDYTVLAGTQGTRNHKSRTGCSNSPSDSACRWSSSPRAGAAGRAIPKGSA